jgi:hypothetical protein
MGAPGAAFLADATTSLRSKEQPRTRALIPPPAARRCFRREAATMAVLQAICAKLLRIEEERTTRGG